MAQYFSDTFPGSADFESLSSPKDAVAWRHGHVSLQMNEYSEPVSEEVREMLQGAVRDMVSELNRNIEKALWRVWTTLVPMGFKDTFSDTWTVVAVCPTCRKVALYLCQTRGDFDRSLTTPPECGKCCGLPIGDWNRSEAHMTS